MSKVIATRDGGREEPLTENDLKDILEDVARSTAKKLAADIRAKKRATLREQIKEKLSLSEDQLEMLIQP